MEDCLFCKIVVGQIQSAAIYKDDDALAFLDILPRAPGHALVVPKVHAPTLTDLPADKVGPLFLAVREVANLMLARLKPDGLTVGINHGSMSGQAVDHLHVHIIPRYKGDGGGSIHSVVNNKPVETIDQIKAKLLN